MTVGSVSGFDITESTDLIKIVENKEIVATSANNNTTEEEWELTITFVNLDNNQNENSGKTFEAKMIMQKEKINNLFADYIKNLYTSDGVNGLYLHDSDLTNGANDNSLRYAGADYSLTSKATSAGYNNFLTRNFGGKDPVAGYLVTKNTRYNTSVGMYPEDYYNVLGYDSNKTHYSTLDAALNQAVSDGYLNSHINNFVCFGSDASVCPIDNLYRIIGVFGNQVKLIKYDLAETNLLGDDGTYLLNGYFEVKIRGNNPTSYVNYRWYDINTNLIINDVRYENLWSKSNLNKINLNTNYLNNIGDKWRNMITGHKYVVGGADFDEKVKPADIMEYEINNPDTSIETYYKGRVGLAYIRIYIFN